MSYTFGANYDSLTTADFGGGVLTATVGTGTVITGGKLDCTGNLPKFAKYAVAGNVTATQTGTIKVKYTPNYSGIPSAVADIFCLFETGTTRNMISLRHVSANGALNILMYNSSNNLILNYTSAIWYPTAGQEYEIVFTWDLDTGSQKVLVQGKQHGVTQTVTGTRTATCDYFKVGGYYTDANSNNAYFDDFVYSPSVEVTIPYTPGYTVDDHRELVAPTTATVYGYIYDLSGDPIEGAVISVSRVLASSQYDEASYYMIGCSVTATSDSSGYWELDLIRSSNYESPEKTYYISYTNGSFTKNKIGKELITFSVPELDRVNIADILTADED